MGLRVRGILGNGSNDCAFIQSDLVSSLRALKNYYLLGKGDFWTCFVEESSILMSSPPGPSSQHEVRTPFFQVRAFYCELLAPDMRPNSSL